MSIMNCFLELISPIYEIWIQQLRAAEENLNSYRTIKNDDMRFILIIHIFIKDIFKMKRNFFQLIGLHIFSCVKVNLITIIKNLLLMHRHQKEIRV